MNEVFYFHTYRPLDKARFEKFLADMFQCSQFIWIDEFSSYVTEHELIETSTYIELAISDAGFKYHYSVFDLKTSTLSIPDQVKTLKALALLENIECLTSDEELAPFSWILIEPNGIASTVQTKMADELILVDYYNFLFGAFCTSEKLTDQEESTLITLLKKIAPDWSIEALGPEIETYDGFHKAKDQFQKLAQFGYHYEVLPRGKNEWLSKEEKAVRFIKVMEDFYHQIRKDLCIFPCNHSEIKTIQGGSDSEDFCILITALAPEKIVYKPRRNSWESTPKI